MGGCTQYHAWGITFFLQPIDRPTARSCTLRPSAAWGLHSADTCTPAKPSSNTYWMCTADNSGIAATGNVSLRRIKLRIARVPSAVGPCRPRPTAPPQKKSLSGMKRERRAATALPPTTNLRGVTWMPPRSLSARVSSVTGSISEGLQPSLSAYSFPLLSSFYYYGGP